MPPKTAFEVLGLEVTEYEGDDVALIPLSFIRVQDVFGAPFADDEGFDGLDEVDEVEDEPPELPPKDKPPEEPSKEPKEPIAHFTPKRKAHNTAHIQRGFLLVEFKYERLMRPRYRKWVREERKKALAILDKQKAMKAGDSALDSILPSLLGSQNDLHNEVRPLYPTATDAIYKFSLDEMGNPVFEIDDPRIVKYWENRAKMFSKTVSKTVFNNLKQTLTEGIKAGESLQALKLRVAGVYDISASSAKVLTVTRTETAGLMNGVRNEMFELQGFEKKIWSTSGDEDVRTDHVIFGRAGAVDKSFDYATIATVALGGSLLHPGDPNGVAGQIINCRCCETPA
jgi:hypothetical protein